MNPLVFNFYEIVRLEVRTDDKRVEKFYIGEYGHHLDQDEKPYQSVIKLTLNVNKLRESTKFSKYTHKYLARWRYWLEFREGNIEINAIGNYFSIPMIHHMLVHHSLRYLSACKGTMMLHSGAVSRHGQSVIFSGQGGTGKTTTTSILLSNLVAGWQVHADDYVFITPEPRSLAYMTRQHIYLPLLEWVPQLSEVMTVKERIELFLFGKIRKWSRDGFKWPVRISPERAWPQNGICFDAKPAGLVLLRRGHQPNAELVPVTDVNAAVKELLEMNFSEAHYFISLVSSIHPGFTQILEDWKARERELLTNIIAKITLYELCLPQKSVDFQKASKEVSSLVSTILNPSGR